MPFPVQLTSVLLQGAHFRVIPGSSSDSILSKKAKSVSYVIVFYFAFSLSRHVYQVQPCLPPVVHSPRYFVCIFGLCLPLFFIRASVYHHWCFIILFFLPRVSPAMFPGFRLFSSMFPVSCLAVPSLSFNQLFCSVSFQPQIKACVQLNIHLHLLCLHLGPLLSSSCGCLASCEKQVMNSDDKTCSGWIMMFFAFFIT